MRDGDRDTKLRAFPWLSPALERSSVDHGNGAVLDNGRGGAIMQARRSSASEEEGEGGPELAAPAAAATSPGEEVEDGDVRDVVVERGLCRLVQAATSAAKGEGEGGRR